ncbi:OprO/OprP family phosphate-selective porin [Vibrio sp. JC009]|uniref:hypothetical protein n=1 Tax=Vibrio sp. JC009 TaxID=2912314 RepID=UPI0023AEB4CA|nr:hypothetical protein [Vibrio sp. JC009]WED22458.1 OprO/OprP family phosphate-selective porin [Vibrio sp. JC009]
MIIKNYVAPALMLASGLAVAGDSVDERIANLENEIQMLKSQSSESILDRVSVNGFFSAGMTRSDNDVGYAGTESSYEFESLSLLGLQAEFAAGEETSVITQLIARGSDDFDPEFEWAYIRHTFDNYVTARAGKLRVPLYMYSDYLDVGYSQPWVRPPEEVYGTVPFNAYLGVDLAYDVEFDDSTLSLQAFGGRAEESGIEFDSVYGASASWSYEEWLLRGVYGYTEITVSDSSNPVGSVIEDGSKSNFYGLGLSYDDGELLFVSELTRVKVDGQYSDTDSGYATLGYRFGQWMPYISYARMETTDNEERVGETVSVNGITIPTSLLADAEHDAYSVGVRYELSSSIAIKADATLIDNFNGTTGIINNSLPARNISSSLQPEEDSSVVYAVRLDCVF